MKFKTRIEVAVKRNSYAEDIEVATVQETLVVQPKTLEVNLSP